MCKLINDLLEKGVDGLLSEAGKLAEKPWGPKIIYSPDDPEVQEKIKEISRLLIKAYEIEAYIDSHKNTKRKYKGTMLTFGVRMKGTGTTIESMMAADACGLLSYNSVQWYVDKKTNPSEPKVKFRRFINGKYSNPIIIKT